MIIHKAVETFRSVAAPIDRVGGMVGWTLIPAEASLAQLGLHRLYHLFLHALIPPAAKLLALIVLQLFTLLRLLECAARLAGLMRGGLT